MIRTLLLLTLLLPVCTNAANYYWVGGSGNWSNYAAHWATTSGGGTFHTQVPSSLDDVFFDANSFSGPGQTVTADQTIVYCRHMDWTGVTNMPSFAALNPNITLKIYGSLAFSAGMNLAFNGTVSMETLSSGMTVTSAGRTFSGALEFNGFGGEWTLQDSLHSTNEIMLSLGVLRTNNHNIRCADFTSSGNAPRSLFLGTSTVTLPGSYASFAITDSLITLDADSAIIRIELGDFYVHGKTSRFKFNLVEFYSTSGVMMDQVYRGTNTHAKKVIFRSYGEIRRPSNRIDSLICHDHLWINGYGDIDLTYAQVANDLLMHTPSNAPADSIQYITIGGNMELGQVSSANNYFGKALINGDLLMDTQPGDVQTFVYCSIGGDGTFTADNTFDTLKLSVGRTYEFESGRTQTITQYFDAFGQPGFPIQWVASGIGTQSTLNLLQPYFCTDYIYVRDMNGTGPGQRFLGANSNNVANNTGWQFVACSPMSVEEEMTSGISVFPNPAEEQWIISLASFSTPLQAQVLDLQGRTVKRFTLSAAQTSIDCADWARGVYILKLTDENGAPLSSRLVKR